jgi:hypothetical protein
LNAKIGPSGALETELLLWPACPSRGVAEVCQAETSTASRRIPFSENRIEPNDNKNEIYHKKF